MGRVVKIPEPYPKQKLFFEAKGKYIAYGGARGGGKSWAARIKAVLLATTNSGIQILFLRRQLKDLQDNHLLPLQKLLNGAAVFKESKKEFHFPKFI